jgi:hypothetical protein
MSERHAFMSEHQNQPPTRKPSPVELKIDPKIPRSMVINLYMLGVMVLFSVGVLMFADFEGKVVRVVATLLLFGLFTLFAAMDAARDKPARYVQIGQFGHMYMLALNLLLIWGSLLANDKSADIFGGMGIFMNMLLLVGIIKVAIVIVQFFSDFTLARQRGLALSALISSLALAVTGVLFTLPIGLNPFFTFTELYWKLSVIVMVVAAGAMSATGLLYNFFKEKDVTVKPSERRASAQTSPPRYGDQRHDDAVSREQGSTFNVPIDRAGQPQPVQQAVAPQPVTAPRQAPGYAPPAPTQQPTSQPQNGQIAGPPQFARPIPGVQPWPVYPHGMPLPANEHGRPDFRALQHIAGMYAEAERQWYQ